MPLSRTALLLISSVALVAADAAAPQPTVRGGLPGYTLAWNDEFTSPAVDIKRWSFRTDPTIWSAQQRQNVAVADGNLVVNLRKESVAGKGYTGGGVLSKETFRFGFYEARVRIPAGAGWSTSIRLQAPVTAQNESTLPSLRSISLFENASINGGAFNVMLSVAEAGMPVTAGGKTVTTPGLADGFQVVGVEFTERMVTFYRDGEVQQSIDLTMAPVKSGSSVTAEPGQYRWWLSCVAANQGGTTAVDDAALPATMTVDYVRFFAPAK